MAQHYALPRHVGESQRLNLQHRLYTDAFGHLLHPNIVKALPSNAYIADVATGTGVFMTELAGILPPTVNFHGFDISDAQFPSSLPPNAQMHVHNAKEPFPQEWKGKFDVVHIRLLICALVSPEDWECVARNAVALLKPGGYIQWIESNFTQIMAPSGILRSTLDASVTGTQKISHEIVEGMYHIYQQGWSTLPGIFNVFQDVVSTDRQPENREMSVLAITGAWQGLYRSYRANGSIKSDEDIEAKCAEIGRVLKEEMATGMYLRWDIHNTIGQTVST